jgi:acetyltransferase
VARAALHQAKIHVVEDGLTLFDLAATLAQQPPLAGRRVAVITNSGGTGVEIADLADAHGLSLPQLSQALQATLRPLLPAHASVHNPIDVTTAWHRFPQMYASCLESLLGSEEIDGVVAVLVQRSALMPEVAEQIIATLGAARARCCTKPVHVAWAGPAAASDNRRRLLAAGIPCHDGSARAIRVLALTAPTAASRAPDQPCSTTPGAPAHTWLPADVAFRLTADAGLPIAPWRLVSSRAEAIAAANALSMPVVLKAEHPDLLHKSERGGVHLGLNTTAAVGVAYDDVAQRLGSASAIVQKQADPGIELVFGARRDASFGPVVMAGLGGIWVEALGDVALRLAPVDATEALAMLDELKGSCLLTGGRGRPAVDRTALAHLIAALSKWIACATWLEEFDANPVIANADGFVIVDVRMRASASAGEIAIYPQH